MRTFLKYVLAIIGGILAFIALLVTSTWLLVGTPSHIASTAMRVVESPQAGAAVGDMLVEQVLSGADAQSLASLEPKRPALAAAAGAALAQQGEAIGAVIESVVDATASGTPTRVDMAPILGPVLIAMNAVDSQVPTQVDGEVAFDVNPAELPPLASILSIFSTWWIAVLLAAIALVGAALCDRRWGFRRFRIAGIALSIPAVLLIIANIGGSAASSGASDDPRAQGLIDAAVGVVRSSTLLVSGVALAIGIVVIVLSIVITPKAMSVESVASTASEPA